MKNCYPFLRTLLSPSIPRRLKSTLDRKSSSSSSVIHTQPNPMRSLRIQKTEEDLRRYFHLSNDESSSILPDHVTSTQSNMLAIQEKKDVEHKFKTQQDALFQEARWMTLHLYRQCIRSVQLLRKTPVHTTTSPQDPTLFVTDRIDPSHSSSRPHSSRTGASTSPTTMSKNEIESRYQYYLQYTREGFYQELDCLQDNVFPWRKEMLERFLYLIRRGEEHRRWILQDYHLEEKKMNSNPQSVKPFHAMEEMDHFEARARDFIKQVYAFKGWELYDSQDNHSIDDDSWEEDDEEEGYRNNKR